MEDFVYIGRVANTHGVQGAIRVFPTTDDPSRFELLKTIYIEDAKGKTSEYHIQWVKYNKQFVLLQLKEIKDMDSAMLLKQGIIKIPKEQALPLEEDEYYLQDLMGIEVWDDQDQHIGPLVDIIFTGSNDVYVVDNGSKNGLLLPAIKECILSVDILNKKMIVKILEGLMD